MGLFGGFRAKFTKDSVAKSASKNSKKNEVVCVGYKEYSEFQDPPQYLPQQPAIRKRPSAIKTVLPRPELSKHGNEINPAGASTSLPIETRIITNPNAKKPSKKNSTDISHKIVAVSSSGNKQDLPSLETLNISNSSAETSTVELRNDKPKKNSRSAPNSMYVVGKTSSFNPDLNISNTATNHSDRFGTQDKEPPKSILKSKSLVEKSESNSHVSDTGNHVVVTGSNHNNGSDQDDVYSRTLTTSSTKSSKSNEYKTEAVDYLSATQSVSKNDTSHISTYVHTATKASNNSEGTVETNPSNSYYNSGYSYSQNTRNIGSTSSYAASIFFGGNEEPEVLRPRKVNYSIAQHEEESRSSAEC